MLFMKTRFILDPVVGDTDADLRTLLQDDKIGATVLLHGVIVII